MKYLLALTFLAAFAAAQQQPKAPCLVGQPEDAMVCKGSINQRPPVPAKVAWTPSPAPAWESPKQASDYQTQLQLRNQATFTLAPAVARSAAFSNAVSNSFSNAVSNYVPPPQLTALHQPSDDFHSTAGFALGATMTREIQVHRENAFVKKFCKTYGSGVAWWYQFGNGDRIEGICQ
jgi:hypothetical protein